MNDELELFENTKLQELSKTEKDLLIDCESVIEKGIEAFKDTWYALLEIRENRLYRSTHKSFKDYCKDKWNISESYVNRQIQAGKIIEDIKDTPIGTGLNESQLRPLTNLESETRREVVKQVFQISEKPTAKVIQELVNKNVGLNEILKELKLNPDLVFKSEEELIEKAKSLIPAPAPVVQEIIKHVEIIKDGELMDKLEQKDVYINQLKSSLSDKNKSLSDLEKLKSEKYSLERQLQATKNDLQRLEALDINEDKINETMQKLIAFEQRQKQLSEAITISNEMIKVIVDSRKFFAENLLILNELKVTPDSLDNVRNTSLELSEIVENWLIEFKNKFNITSNNLRVI